MQIPFSKKKHPRYESCIRQLNLLYIDHPIWSWWIIRNLLYLHPMCLITNNNTNSVWYSNELSSKSQTMTYVEWKKKKLEKGGAPYRGHFRHPLLLVAQIQHKVGPSLKFNMHNLTRGYRNRISENKHQASSTIIQLNRQSNAPFIANLDLLTNKKLSHGKNKWIGSSLQNTSALRWEFMSRDQLISQMIKKGRLGYQN